MRRIENYQRFFTIGIIITWLWVVTASAGSLATHSFTNKAGTGTHPQTLGYVNGIITVDLSAISGAEVYRAIFDPNRLYTNSGGYRENTFAMENMVLQSAGGDTLELVGPRYLTFDATASVRAVLDAGGTELLLTVVSTAGLGAYNETLSLEVMCDRPLPEPLVHVSEASALHRGGDTLITFMEFDSPLVTDTVTCEAYNTAIESLDDKAEIRYRIYRSRVPVTDETAIIDAEFIDEIKPLSCWNAKYYGKGNCTGDKIVSRFPVDDGMTADPGTGIYVHRFKGENPETAWYFVSRSVDGAEDFESLLQADTVTQEVTESPGTGMVLERSIETPDTFMYVSDPTLHYYVRWECPPTCNLPSEPFNYLVAQPGPDDAIVPAPVDVALHCWGGSLNSGYGWWYRAEEGSLLLATNQYPYDWWTAYHENYHTLKSFADGTVQPFNQVRILSFLFDFVAERFEVDQTRLLLSGSSMGGSGTSMWGMRSGHIFSHLISWVGIHDPEGSDHFFSSFETVYGRSEWGTAYSNAGLARFGYETVLPEDAVNVFDYWDTGTWLRERPGVETPWISFANGKNDAAIGWPQAHAYVQALWETRRPFNFHWGMAGHGQRAQLIDGGDHYSGLDFARDTPLPVFIGCSLDDDLGQTPEDGVDTGQINRWFAWDPASILQTSERFEITVRLIDSAPAETCTVNLGLRRFTDFQVLPQARIAYENQAPDGTPVGSGVITADENGLLLIPDLEIQRHAAGNRIVLTPVGAWRFDLDGDQDVDGTDFYEYADAGVFAEIASFADELGLR